MRSEPKFYLKNNKATTKTPIILNLKIHNKTFRYSIQKSIEPELWDKTTQRPTKNNTIRKEYKKHIPTLKEELKDIENRIINIDRDVRNYLNQLEQSNIILVFADLKAYLNLKYRKVIVPKKENTENQLNSFIDYFINGIETGEIKIDTGVNFGKKYKPSTIKSWKEWKTQFNNFQKYYGILKWDTINMEVYDEIVDYFFNKNLSVNTVGKQIKSLKTILRKGYEKQYHTNEIFRVKKFRVLTEEIDKVTLNFDEINDLKNLDLTDNKQLDFHRDIFLIGCYSALRISDIKRLNKSHIKNEKYIKIRMAKTEDAIVIPIRKELMKILLKYDCQIPKIQMQKFRKDIKVICKLAGLNEDIEVKSSKGGNINYISEPKYVFVSSHTARRTGATLMFLSGIPPLLIQSITGHKKESSLMRYINISKEKTAELLADNSFFK